MKTVQYEEQNAWHNGTECHPYYSADDFKNDTEALKEQLDGFTPEERLTIIDFTAKALKRLLQIIIDGKDTAERSKANAIASRACLIHRALVNPTMPTRDIAAAYGVGGNMIYRQLDELAKECKELEQLVRR